MRFESRREEELAACCQDFIVSCLLYFSFKLFFCFCHKSALIYVESMLDHGLGELEDGWSVG